MYFVQISVLVLYVPDVPGHVPQMSRNLARLFSEMSRIILDISPNFPGKILDMTLKFPRSVPELHRSVLSLSLSLPA